MDGGHDNGQPKRSHESQNYTVGQDCREVVAECSRDGHSCKFKLQKLLADYKKVGDHNRKTRRGEKDYFILKK